jgi:hypothetical protein
MAGQGGRKLRFLAVGAFALWGTGCIGLGKLGDAREEVSPAVRNFTRKVGSIVEGTNVVRGSGQATAARLKILFPLDFYPTDELDFSPESIDVRLRSIGAPDRPVTAMSHYALRDKILRYCKNADQGTLFDSSEARLLMPSERAAGITVPEEEHKRLALAVARNAWLFPYARGSDEVQALERLYLEALAESGEASTARRMLCIGALEAPQFWLGNQEAGDQLRRVTLEIGLRPPTMEEYDLYLQDKLDLAAHVRTLQGGDSYRTFTRELHTEWMGFRRISNGSGMELRLGSYQSATMANPRRSLLYQRYQPDGTAIPGTEYLEIKSSMDQAQTTPMHIWDSQYCERDRDEPFDPRTTEIVWQQRIPAGPGGTYRTVGSWRRVKDGEGRWTEGWETVPGEIDLGGRSSTLADISYSVSCIYLRPIPADCDPEDAANQYVSTEYDPQTGIVTHTPTAFAGVAGLFKEADRRIIRRAVSGDQTGVSKVRQWWTGATVRVCNGLDRFLTTCTLRPNTRKIFDFYYDQSTEYYSQMTQWNATKPRIPGFYYFMSMDALFHPKWLDSMKCGIPDPAAIAALPSPKDTAAPALPWDHPKEHVAYPFGYARPSEGSEGSFAADSPIPPGLSDHAVWTELAYDNYPNKHAPTPDYANGEWTELVDGPAAYRMNMRDEPFLLLEDALAKKDYRLLLTADYTFANEAYELLLRGQGYYLPVHPPGFARRPPELRAARTKVTFSAFADIPFQWLESTIPDWNIETITSGSGDKDEERRLFGDLEALRKIPPKAHSGILNMPVFLMGNMPNLEQDALGPRTLASRVFERLLCGGANSILLTDGQESVHEPFIPHTEAAADFHLDKTRGCYSCHINLDPLAAALHSHFQQNVFWLSAGELRYMQSSGYGGRWYGIRGGGKPTTGAVLGKVVTDVREVGQTVANSEPFHRCAVQKSFERVYGRGVTLADMPMFRRVIANFRSHHDFNRMIQDLASAPEMRGKQ